MLPVFRGCPTALQAAVPQLPQNFAPGGSGLLQFLHVFGSIDCPQLLQNFAPACTCAWQLGHSTDAACCACMFAPQFWQNLTPAALGVSHFGQGTVCADAAPPPCCCPPPGCPP